MAISNPRPCGDFRTDYASDTRLFADRAHTIGFFCLLALALVAPFIFDGYIVSLMILIGIYGIGALGLNILIGFTGQISLGHAAFFGFGAFSSAWLNTNTGIPVLITIPLAGIMTTAVGMIFGVPAARIKGLYLAIATLAAQFILQDFYARAEWFTGGSAGSLAEIPELFGFAFNTDQRYYYLVLFWVCVSFLLASNLMRSRDGRALVAVRDHYLSAEVMGINLTKYRILSFGVSSFFAGIGGALMGHYLGYVSVEGFTILVSVLFLAMIIIGGLGSIAGTLLGTAFIVLLPQFIEFLVGMLSGPMPFLIDIQAYIKEMAIGLAIIIFLIFEPDGLIHRWQLIRAYWRLYPFSY